MGWNKAVRAVCVTGVSFRLPSPPGRQQNSNQNVAPVFQNQLNVYRAIPLTVTANCMGRCYEVKTELSSTIEELGAAITDRLGDEMPPNALVKLYPPPPPSNGLQPGRAAFTLAKALAHTQEKSGRTKPQQETHTKKNQET